MSAGMMDRQQAWQQQQQQQQRQYKQQQQTYAGQQQGTPKQQLQYDQRMQAQQGKWGGAGAHAGGDRQPWIGSTSTASDSRMMGVGASPGLPGRLDVKGGAPSAGSLRPQQQLQQQANAGAGTRLTIQSGGFTVMQQQPQQPAYGPSVSSYPTPAQRTQHQQPQQQQLKEFQQQQGVNLYPPQPQGVPGRQLVFQPSSVPAHAADRSDAPAAPPSTSGPPRSLSLPGGHTGQGASPTPLLMQRQQQQSGLRGNAAGADMRQPGRQVRELVRWPLASLPGAVGREEKGRGGVRAVGDGEVAEYGVSVSEVLRLLRNASAAVVLGGGRAGSAVPRYSPPAPAAAPAAACGDVAAGLKTATPTAAAAGAAGAASRAAANGSDDAAPTNADAATLGRAAGVAAGAEGVAGKASDAAAMATALAPLSVPAPGRAQGSGVSRRTVAKRRREREMAWRTAFWPDKRKEKDAGRVAEGREARWEGSGGAESDGGDRASSELVEKVRASLLLWCVNQTGGVR